MKTYYSIIKVIPNSLVSDAISIGMILSDDEKFYVSFSNAKIKIAKSLLADKKKLLDYFIVGIEKAINGQQEFNRDQNSDLFGIPTKINSAYLSYLNKYSNNIIQYDEPKFIMESNSQKTFETLYSLLIDKGISKHINYEIPQSIWVLQDNVQKKLITKVKDKVHTKIKITDKHIPSLYFNYEMDCIGLNGVFTGAKALNFDQSEQTIQKDISNYYALATMLENLHNKAGKANNFFLITDEPVSIISKQHQIWEKLKKGKKFRLIRSEESNIVANIIEETNAGMFLNVD